MQVFEDVACRRQILDLQVKCANDQCPWQGELRGLEVCGTTNKLKPLIKLAYTTDPSYMYCKIYCKI